MKYNLQQLCILLACCFGGLSLTAENTDKDIFRVTNSSDNSFKNAPIVIPRNSFEQSFGVIKPGQTVHFYISGNLVPSQLDDLNNDAIWDEIALAVDLDKNTTVEVKVVINNDLHEFENQTNIRIGQFKNTKQEGSPIALETLSRTAANLPADFSRQFQMEGPAWENQHVGFRLYFDERNGIDIFGKTTPKMALDKVGISENYHQRQAWGMDILKVGRSLGAGALAFRESGKKDDVLTRLANAEETVANILAEGPVRSILELSYKNLPIIDDTANLTQRITIWSGQHHYESEITVTGLSKDIDIAVGIVNFFDLKASQKIDEKHVMLSTFGVQAEEKTLLGMGVLAEASKFSTFGTIKKADAGIEMSEYATFKLDNNSPLKYQFFAVWEPGNASFKQHDDLINHMIEVSQHKQSISVDF